MLQGLGFPLKLLFLEAIPPSHSQTRDSEPSLCLGVHYFNPLVKVGSSSQPHSCYFLLLELPGWIYLSEKLVSSSENQHKQKHFTTRCKTRSAPPVSTQGRARSPPRIRARNDEGHSKRHQGWFTRGKRNSQKH